MTINKLTLAAVLTIGLMAATMLLASLRICTKQKIPADGSL